MKKRKSNLKISVGQRTKKLWLADDIVKFDNLCKQLNYPNAVVQKQASEEMFLMQSRLGHDVCMAMGIHIDAGLPLVDGPRMVMPQ